MTELSQAQLKMELSCKGWFLYGISLTDGEGRLE